MFGIVLLSFLGLWEQKQPLQCNTYILAHCCLGFPGVPGRDFLCYKAAPFSRAPWTQSTGKAAGCLNHESSAPSVFQRDTVRQEWCRQQQQCGNVQNDRKNLRQWPCIPVMLLLFCRWSCCIRPKLFLFTKLSIFLNFHSIERWWLYSHYPPGARIYSYLAPFGRPKT